MRRSFVHFLPALSLALPIVQSAEKGEKDTKSWRLFFYDENKATAVSAWHDLPLRPTASPQRDPLIFTFVNEIPRGTRAKMELMKEEMHNPIAQDILKKKDGAPLRYFSYGDMPFNYGFIPRTWEDPDLINAETSCKGDGDPVDVVQLDSLAVPTGRYMAVRVLGVLGLIDQGETDWKIITERVAPGKEKEGYGSIDKVPQATKDAITDWFRNYKTTEGKPQNEFAFGGEIRGAEDALAVIQECSKHYDHLMATGGSRHGYWLK